jgi:hypothetical protein
LFPFACRETISAINHQGVVDEIRNNRGICGAKVLPFGGHHDCIGTSGGTQVVDFEGDGVFETG